MAATQKHEKGSQKHEKSTQKQEYLKARKTHFKAIITVKVQVIDQKYKFANYVGGS